MSIKTLSLWLIFATICCLISHAPLSAIRNQTPAEGIGTTNVSVVAWCNKQNGTIMASTNNGSWASSTTISSGNGNAFNPLVAVDDKTGNTAVVWIETDPATKKFAVYGTFYTNYLNVPPFYTGPFNWVLPPTQLSISGRNVVPEDLNIAINTAHLAGNPVNVIVTWSEYISGDHVISAVLGIVKSGTSSLNNPPSWLTPAQEGP